MTSSEEAHVLELMDNEDDNALYQFYSDYVEKKRNESRKNR